MTKEYKTSYILELAFAAQRINKGYVKQTRRYSEGQPTTWSNKELVSFTASYKHSPKDSIYLPSDFVPIKVTEEDREAVVAAEKHMRRYTMLSLGKLTDFQVDMFAAYANETVLHNRIGLLAYLPQFIERELDDKIYKARLKSDFRESRPISGQHISGKLEILKGIWSSNYETFFYTAGFEGNLVMFSNRFEMKVGDFYNFKAKVKNHSTDNDTGLVVNRINYVKLIKV